MLAISELVVRYGAVAALQGVDLEIGPGEAVGVIGPNGAGKTSLLRCLAGLVKPAAGRITLDGRRISGRPAHTVARAGIALVPEGRGTLSPLSVRENLVLGGYHRPRNEVDEHIGELCELFPVLGERLDSTAGLLSGGEQQMLAIARGLMAKPRLLALDEPSMGLAPKVVDDILDALHRVLGQGTAILLAEQNAALVLDATDRSYVLVNGGIVASGAGDEVGEDLLAHYLA
jgi:branched-chain amino acid transport system ATP-binding protein